MIAAIYARKSTEQNGVSHEDKSVMRQNQGGAMETTLPTQHPKDTTATTPTKILVICTGNRCRSKTCEAMLRNTPGFEARSAGTHPVLHGRPITREDLTWADTVLVFEQFHITELERQHGPSMLTEKPIINLSIPDEYPPYDAALIHFLKERFALYFETPLADPIRPDNWWDL
jgi:predicted protein tyrosine phosphatase